MQLALFCNKHQEHLWPDGYSRNLPNGTIADIEAYDVPGLSKVKGDKFWQIDLSEWWCPKDPAADVSIWDEHPPAGCQVDWTITAILDPSETARKDSGDDD